MGRPLNRKFLVICLMIQKMMKMVRKFLDGPFFCSEQEDKVDAKKTTISKQKVSSSLFGDDSDEDDIFAPKPTGGGKSNQVNTPKKATSPPKRATKSIFDDSD